MKIPTAENLATIRVVYLMPFTLMFAGIPYEMRPGQSPRHLLDATASNRRPIINDEGYKMAPRDWTDDWINLDHPDASDFVARLRKADELPRFVHEYVTISAAEVPGFDGQCPACANERARSK